MCMCIYIYMYVYGYTTTLREFCPPSAMIWTNSTMVPYVDPVGNHPGPMLCQDHERFQGGLWCSAQKASDQQSLE